MGNGELSKMGCFESDLQEFRIRQETRGQLLSGSLDVPCALCPFGRGGDCDVWEKEVETQFEGTERRGVGRAAWTPRSFSDPDPHPCPQAVLVFLGFSEPLPTPYKMLLFSCIA